jgi:serine/threonine protein kinase
MCTFICKAGHDNRSVLPWEVRFKVAVAVAEALNYLHNECSPPVIHRDVKSSNILLSNEFQPQVLLPLHSTFSLWKQLLHKLFL